MVVTMLGSGRCCGKAVAIRWRATGGAGHIRHDERADWPFGRSRGRAAGALPRSPIIRGRMRLRPQAAPWERCRLRQRPTIRVVRASCTRRFLWRLIERNNYELAGSHCGIQ